MPFELFARLGLDQRAFASGLTQAKGKVAGFAQSIKGQIAAAFGTAAVTAAITLQAKKTIAYADKINDLAKAWGMSTEQLQEFDYAATQNGTTVEKLIAAQRELAKARAEALADPGGEAARAFAQIAIDHDALRSITDAGELMVRFSDAVKGVSLNLNSLPVILSLLGEKNAEVLPAMQAGLRDVAKEARLLGIVMGDEVVQQLGNIADEMEVIEKRLTVGLAPALAKVADLFTEAVGGFRIAWAGARAALTEAGKDRGDTPVEIKSKQVSDAAFDAMMAETMKQIQEEAVIRRAQERKKVRRMTSEEMLAALDSIQGKDKRPFFGPGFGPDSTPASAPAGRKGADSLVRDDLARIGGFTGSAGKGEQLLQRANEWLRDIERNTKPGQGGDVFP